MLDPKHFVMATPQVIRGAPILVAYYSPDDNDDLGPLAGPGPGEFGGWTFVHELADEGLPEDAALYFFEQLGNVDAAVQAIIEEGLPGAYLRESPSSPFEREEL